MRTGTIAIAVLLQLAAGPTIGLAQRADTTRAREVLLNADSLFGERIGERFIRRLIGNVELVQEGTRLWSDKARQVENDDTILFEGNVQIVERGDTLTASVVRYNRATKVGTAIGNVRLTDGQVVVRSPSAIYHTNDKRTVFDSSVTLTDSATVLTSSTGIYWSDEKRAEFAGAVRLSTEEARIEADSLTYLRDNKISTARGDVFLDSIESDTAGWSRTFVFAGHVRNDENEARREFTGSPLMIRVSRDVAAGTTDTVWVVGDRLLSVGDGPGSRLTARGQAALLRSDIAARADSIRFIRSGKAGAESNRILMFGTPRAWMERTQISSDTLIFSGREGAMDSLLARGRAFLALQDSASGRINQIRGRDITGSFKGDSARTVVAGPNAEAVYYLIKDGSSDGAVRTSADRIILYTRNDSLQSIKVYRGIEGTYYEQEHIPAELSLTGFDWDPTSAPRQPELLGRARDPDRLGRPDWSRSTTAATAEGR